MAEFESKQIQSLLLNPPATKRGLNRPIQQQIVELKKKEQTLWLSKRVMPSCDDWGIWTSELFCRTWREDSSSVLRFPLLVLLKFPHLILVRYAAIGFDLYSSHAINITASWSSNCNIRLYLSDSSSFFICNGKHQLVVQFYKRRRTAKCSGEVHVHLRYPPAILPTPALTCGTVPTILWSIQTLLSDQSLR